MSTKQHTLLGALVVTPGQTASAHRLIDELWGGDPPTNACGRAPADNSASAVTGLTAVPPARGVGARRVPAGAHSQGPRSTECTGPLLLSRTGRGLDRVTFPRLLRDVAATHPDLKEIALCSRTSWRTPRVRSPRRPAGPPGQRGRAVTLYRAILRFTEGGPAVTGEWEAAVDPQVLQGVDRALHPRPRRHRPVHHRRERRRTADHPGIISPPWPRPGR